MSLGRLGAVTGPTLAGLLMAAGWDRGAVCVALALPMLAAAACLAGLRPASAGSRPPQGIRLPAAG
jgi:hypothetical protein